MPVSCASGDAKGVLSQTKTMCWLRMSQLAEEYRRKAQAAEALAEATRDEPAREAYLEAAERWRRLAERAEKNSW